MGTAKTLEVVPIVFSLINTAMILGHSFHRAKRYFEIVNYACSDQGGKAPCPRRMLIMNSYQRKHAKIEYYGPNDIPTMTIFKVTYKA
ncbi:hypothetical protein Desaci_0860 [Desulfosporosinus acidiphilus SJ4]|uniref:Uncharacterized protein n=1 Tax=Desulfosporosinus acidiphilus (strain DSM 22704 / JCM 16185 / SJ4) TaxID=646529 RepID=I4D291_DESAJ|nr:hypothetical protein Desaci_0860 [Desulfosporosinus acidiphilus SJ4]